MPAANQKQPDALPSRIQQWLDDHPGWHRARDIADGLGVPDDSTRAKWSQKVGNAVSRMVTGAGRGKGGVLRDEQHPEGWAKPIGVYASAKVRVLAFDCHTGDEVTFHTGGWSFSLPADAWEAAGRPEQMSVRADAAAPAEGVTA